MEMMQAGSDDTLRLVSTVYLHTYIIMVKDVCSVCVMWLGSFGASVGG